MPRQVINADEAKRLADNPLLNEIFDRIIKESIDQLDEDKLEDYQLSNANRDRMILKVQVVNEVRARLKNIVNNAER